MPKFDAGFVFDPSNPIKRYPLIKNGENIASVRFPNTYYYYSDIDTSDAGGYFDLTKFDTVKKTISGYLEFTGYQLTSGIPGSFTTVKIDNLPLIKDTLKYNGNTASFNFQDKTMAYVNTNNVTTGMATCGSNRIQTVLIYIRSIMFDKPVKISIPLSIGKGTYPVYPDIYQYIVPCEQAKITSGYSGRRIDQFGVVESGTVNILNIDTALRKNATFNIRYRDTTSGQIYSITNGKVDLITWNAWEN
ncbi:hypothetical protein A4H97_30535 [Niastella yeongjuensis]|uniref:Uncharacterized protein n=1 Tax=Niastella yeongjuensis TaxID=354355 RepID=A0A1V9ENZ3_9BACT|nr:hypothetical protein [Niastella yeongjuensis]OQP47850.1 hypothetical protein A4H97_30535 [Niastella yeongjuensis]SEP48299.1 hypothetical protein SAMN05660816_06738 [Niastella yeongjuensis]